MRRSWRAPALEPGWLLLPLRAFLAVVFLDAGISKVADSRFLDASDPQSMHASVLAARSFSPVGGLLGPVAAHSFAFGILMAAAELAVGLGLAAGLFTRVAAAGGMALSLILWLTVSWSATPWFTSADVVYLFALTPLAIGGAGPVSLDGWLARARAAQPDAGEDRTRRSLLGVGAAVTGAVLLGGAWLARQTNRSARQRSEDDALPVQALTATSAVPVGGGKQVTVSSVEEPAWVLQLTAGKFTALDARCPHQGCTVAFISPTAGFVCPCHQSHFSAQGARLSGPAPTGLTPIPVRVHGGEVRTT